MKPTITREQIKAGRDLLGLTQPELCKAAGIPLITLRRLEGRADHTGLVSETTLHKVKYVMETLGVQFLQEGDIAQGNGVSLIVRSR